MELMVVVAILALIVSIGYPSYTSFIRKSHRADGRNAVQEAVARQERIYNETLSYVDNTGLSKLLVNSDGISSQQGYYQLAVTIPVTPTTCTANSRNSCFSITATAVGGQAADTTCATLTMDYLGAQTSTGGGDCW